MSLAMITNVVCDNCGEMTDDCNRTGGQARNDARSMGWRVSLPGGRDLCPDCR